MDFEESKKVKKENAKSESSREEKAKYLVCPSPSRVRLLTDEGMARQAE
jgi:hypothetical protein